MLVPRDTQRSPLNIIIQIGVRVQLLSYINHMHYCFVEQGKEVIIFICWCQEITTEVLCNFILRCECDINFSATSLRTRRYFMAVSRDTHMIPLTCYPSDRSRSILIICTIGQWNRAQGTGSACIFCQFQEVTREVLCNVILWFEYGITTTFPH